MTSPLAAILSQIATDWEALTPPSRTTKTYHEVDGRTKLKGTSGDRCFWFDLPQMLDTPSEMGAGMTEVEWGIDAVVFISGAGRSVADLVDAVAHESILLRRAIDKRASWPAGTVEVITENMAAEQLENGDVLLQFNLRITTQETD